MADTPRRSGERSRRSALKMLAGAGLAGLAGCLGDDGNGSAGGGDGGGDEGTDGGESTTTGDSTQTESESDLEDELTVYAPTSYEPVFEVFEEEYDVTVNESVYVGSEVTGRFTTEAETGELKADVSIHSLSALTWPNVTQYLAESEIDNEEAIMTEERREVLEEHDGYGKGWPIVSLPYGTTYNTQSVDDPPVAWEDTTDSEWEGRIAMPSLNVRSLYLLRRRRGWDEEEIQDFVLDLDENIDEYPAAAPPTVQGIIGGQHDVGVNLPTHFSREAINDGAPIDVVYPEYVVEWYNGIGVTEDDQNDAPNLSRELVKWMTSDDAQRAIQEEMEFKPANPEMEHGHSHLQQRLEEYDPELVPMIYTQEEAEEVGEILTDLVDRISL